MKFLIPKGLRVLDLGCGTGDLLAALEPELGVGIDFSPVMIEKAKKKYPVYQFILGDIEDPEIISQLSGPFNIIILSDTIGQLDDCQTCLERLHVLCNDDTRIIISYYNSFWQPVLSIAEKCRLKSPQADLNWLSSSDIVNILMLSDFETVKQDWRQLIPRKMLGLGHLVNRFIAPLPLIRKLCIRNYVVARSIRNTEKREYSTTVLIPCRNEMGNIENAIKRIPRFCPDIEIIFVEGHSKDGTLAEIHRVNELL